MPYSDDRLSMLVILPDAGTFTTFDNTFDQGMLDEIVSSLAMHGGVALSLPKFTFAVPLDLVAPMQAVGMTDAFTPGVADLSGIDGAHDLVIQDIVHKAFIDVSESGTEAAAATSVSVGDFAVEEPLVVNVDRPFLFLIRDEPTGAILFMGRVVDPR